MRTTDPELDNEIREFILEMNNDFKAFYLGMTIIGVLTFVVLELLLHNYVSVWLVLGITVVVISIHTVVAGGVGGYIRRD